MWWIEFDYVLALGSKSTCILCGGSKLTVRAEIDLFLVGDRLTRFLCGLSKLTCFSDAGCKSLGFSVSIEIDLVFRVGGRN